MAYDPVRHRIVLFGGFANGNGLRNDTWEYDGTDWTRVVTTTSPPPLADAAMAFDANRGRLILYGGSSAVSTQATATWEYTGTTWNELAPDSNPGARSGHRMAFDAAHNYVLLFGGSTTGDDHAWTWDGTNWTDRGLQAVPG
jgi:hypothetical protein